MADREHAPPAIGTPAWIEGLLRARLGPRAILGALSFEGRLVHLDGARLPLGPRAAMHVTRATVELGAGLTLGELPLSARLVGLHGALEAPGFSLPVDFHGSDDDAAGEAWAHGTLRLGGPGGVASILSVRPAGWSLTRGRLTGEGSVLPPGISRVVAQSFPLSLLPALPGGVALAGTVDLDLAFEGLPAELRARGRLSSPEIQVRRPGAAEITVAALSVELDADRRRVRYRDLDAALRASGGSGRIRGWGRVPLAPPSAEAAGVPLLALLVERADAALVAALAGPRAPRLPPDLTLAGELSVGAGVAPAGWLGAVSGTFAVETPRSALLFRLVLEPSEAGRPRAGHAHPAPGAPAASPRLLGSTLRGRFTAGDAAAVGLVPGSVRPRPDDVLTLDARLTGTLARPGLTGRLAAARLAVAFGREADGSPPLSVEIEDASVLLDVGPDGLAWHELGASLYGGRFTSSGRLGRGTGALAAAVSASGIDITALPARAPGEKTPGAFLGGTASGEVRFERGSSAPHALFARGRIVVADPVYHFVRRFAPTLARYGLPPVSRRGMGPLAADVHLARGELVVAPVAASLDGIDVDGEIHLDVGGDLLGRVGIHLLDGYLSRSPLLALPAALSGKVTIPVYLSGSPGAIEVRTDALEILDGLLAGSRVGEAVKSVLDGLKSAARPGPRRR